MLGTVERDGQLYSLSREPDGRCTRVPSFDTFTEARIPVKRDLAGNG